MSHDLKKAESRLANIQRVKPILAALRTISLGSWQMARNRHAGLHAYTQRLLDLLPPLLPHVAGGRSGGRPGRLWRWMRRRDRKSSGGRVVVLVIGSERGLCGQYNKVILDHLADHLASQAQPVTLMALGSRLIRTLNRAGFEPTWAQALSITSLPSYDLANSLVGAWLEQYESYELDGVDIVYNADRGAGTYAATVTRLIPPALLASKAPSQTHAAVIVETDPDQLYARVVEQWTSVAMYRLLLEAALTEHAARFQLMESATQNADRIIDQLMLSVQSARRQAITREMQELAIGAGLLTTS